MAHEPTYRRVVVAFDSTRASRTALNVSANLAATLGAELAGLFIGDVNQLRLGALPFARITGPGAVSRDIDIGTIERSMRRAASEARASLERLAAGGSTPVPWSFRVVRGAVAPEIGAAADPADLIVVDETALGRAARAALSVASTSVLCLCSSAPRANEVVLIYGESASERRAIQVAARVARATGRTLTLLVPDAAQMEAAAATNAGDVAVRALSIADRRSAFVQAAMQRPGAIVVWPADHEDPETRQALVPLLEGGRLSLLVTR